MPSPYVKQLILEKEKDIQGMIKVLKDYYEIIKEGELKLIKQKEELNELKEIP